jgi:hypothetical protein
MPETDKKKGFFHRSNSLHDKLTLMPGRPDEFCFRKSRQNVAQIVFVKSNSRT